MMFEEMFQTEWESEAFEKNIVRLELEPETGTTIYRTYNSKHEQTALSYITRGGLGHA